MNFNLLIVINLIKHFIVKYFVVLDILSCRNNYLQNFLTLSIPWDRIRVWSCTKFSAITVVRHRGLDSITAVHVSCPQISANEQLVALTRIEGCVKEIDFWMAPYCHLFWRDFNFANLEYKYFAGL